MKKGALFAVSASLVLSIINSSGIVFALLEEVDSPLEITSSIVDTESVVTNALLADHQDEGSNEVDPVKVEGSGAMNNQAHEVPLDEPTPSAHQSVVIAQIQVGVNGDTSNEYVSIYNNSDKTIDVTGWCLTSKNVATGFACLDGLDKEFVMQAHSYISFSSVSRHDNASVSLEFPKCSSLSGCIVGSSDTIQLVNADKELINEISWSGASSKYFLEREWDTQAANRLTTGKDSPAWSWRTGTYQYQYGYIEELVECFDGTLVNDSNKCPVMPIRCLNIPGVLLSDLPEGSEIDDNGNCYENKCTNLPGFHQNIPDGFYLSSERACLLAIEPLQITEVLPNPKGSDEGHEYIEIYNPNDEVAELRWWSFSLNGKVDKVYMFPEGADIQPNGYYLLKNDSGNSFSLTNTRGSVRMRSLDGQFTVDVPEWLNAKDDKAWSLIDGVWQYATPSPGEQNPQPTIALPSIIGLADCGEGRERNPATGRCRNIPTAKELAPCKEGQYRSEETNRCRSIASAVKVLKPCADDQFRNPETNRCKKIASADELADCGEGRERNPKTNRCRNIVATTTIPKVGFAPESVKQTASETMGWYLAGGVSLVAVSYAVWQWRFEIRRFLRRFNRIFVTSRK